MDIPITTETSASTSTETTLPSSTPVPATYTAKDAVGWLLQRKVLVSPELLSLLSGERAIGEQAIIVLKNFLDEHKDSPITAEAVRMLLSQPSTGSYTPKIKPSFKVLWTYKERSGKREMNDFVSYFNKRYQQLSKILRERQELQGATSIARVLQKKNKEAVSIIALVLDKQTTKNGNIILTVEDPTGTIKAIVSKSKQQLLDTAQDIVLDQAVGIIGVSGENAIFVSSIIEPDIPVSTELKKAPEEAYAAFISDIEFGSSLFLHEEMDKFLRWIRGEEGSEKQRHIVERLGYLIIPGDLIAGAGVYPGQEADLAVPYVKEQYALFAAFAKKIPPHIQIIVCAGNHDAVRISEPQPALPKEYAAALYDIPNLSILTNPSMVALHATDQFPGITVLLYHGYSYTYYADTVERIRTAGGLSRTDLIMKMLVKKRHLAPSHTSNRYVPDPNTDPLIIDEVPDIIASGHIHTSTVSNYRNTTLLMCSTWVGQSQNQEKYGITPQPCRVALVNLQTRAVTILKFSSDKTKEKSLKETNTNTAAQQNTAYNPAQRTAQGGNASQGGTA